MQFFHSFPELGITGHKSAPQLEAEGEVIFRHDIRGRTVLDIGAWDGWFSFRAEKLGASEVTACDWFCWSGPGWGQKDCFEFLRRELGSSVKDIECDIPDLSPEKYGTFDVVLLPGVLYHVRDMLTILERAQAMTHDQLIIETVTMPGGSPVAMYWKQDTLSNDPTNFWTPTVACVKDMLSEFGFTRFEVHPTPYRPRQNLKTFIRSTPWLLRLANLLTGRRLTSRHIIHAWRK